jgi:uncharacterized protein YegJ (DUF2314 family)
MTLEPGDYIKVEFKHAESGESEWMWVKVSRADDTNHLVFGTLDNEPIVNTDLRLGMELAISFDNIREPMKASSFNQ